MAELTEADARNWRMREAAHYNGGAAFFAYLHRCIEQPRLARFDRYDRKTRSVTSTWRTDGQDAQSLADAIQRLNVPPVFTAEELAFLAKAPVDYETERRKDVDYLIADAVRNKGAIEYENGLFRLTETGRAALASAN